MTTTDAPTINLLDPQFYVDPYAAYRWLRDNDPVHWDATHRIWGVSRYDDVVEVEKQTALYSSLWGSRPATDQLDDTSMINKDDPEHQRQRMLVARQFTPRAVKQLEDHLRVIVTELIDDVAADGHLRGHRRAGVAAAGHRHRRQARLPARAVAQGPLLVRGHHVRVGPEPPRRHAAGPEPRR